MPLLDFEVSILKCKPEIDVALAEVLESGQFEMVASGIREALVLVKSQ